MPITGEPRRQRPGALLCFLYRRGQGRVDCQPGDAGQRLAGCLDPGQPEHIRRGSPQQLAAPDRQAPPYCARQRCVVPAHCCLRLFQQLAGRPGRKLCVVTEHRDRLGCAQQQPGRVPAGRQQPRHPLRDHRVIPQQPQVPRRVAQCLAHLTEGQQARIRLGRVGQPAQHYRQQRPLDRRSPGHAGSQRLDVAQRARGIDIPERLEPLRGRRRSQPGRLARAAAPPRPAAAGRTASRAAGAPGWRAAAIGPSARRPDRQSAKARWLAGRAEPHPAHGPADLTQHDRVLGQQMRAPELAQLQAGARRAQEAVGGGQVTASTRPT